MCAKANISKKTTKKERKMRRKHSDLCLRAKSLKNISGNSADLLSQPAFSSLPRVAFHLGSIVLLFFFGLVQEELDFPSPSPSLSLICFFLLLAPSYSLSIKPIRENTLRTNCICCIYLHIQSLKHIVIAANSLN